MEITEFEKKRAANLIWNGAQDYSVDAGFRVYDADGRADIYWNSIIGAIHKNYEWKKLMLFYQTFDETFNQGLYENLFWIAMENGAYEREKIDRPVFPYLRECYAQERVKRIYMAYDEGGGEENRANAILRGHLYQALGQDSGLTDLVDRKLLAELEIGPELDTDQAIARIEHALRVYFGYHEPGEKGSRSDKLRMKLAPLVFWKKRGKMKFGEMGPVRALSFGYGEHVYEYGSEVRDQSHLSVSFSQYSAQTDEGLQQYITNYFGKSIYDRRTVGKMEKEYCVGNHQDVKLHITRGAGTAEMLEKGYAGQKRREALAQAEANEKAYREDLVRHRIAVEKLTARIRNSVMIHMDDQVVKSTTGMLDATRIWRGVELDDDRVFRKELKGDNGNITVDILLDASTSQLHRQEVVSAQGYMIAEALTKCGIPTRVYSFCSLNGYTIVNLYRDYGETGKNREIFRYFTTGANRDGMAIRLAAGMMKDNHADHRILIVLSDCKPNDVLKVRTSGGQYKDYAAQLGVEDTAAEVHAAKMKGINVLCVFTGNDEDLPSVRRIYGTGYGRIKSLDMFADTVGSMLQREIALT